MKLFVRNLAWSATEDDLFKFLDVQGYLVTDVKIAYDEDQRRSRGYGFVTFKTQDMYDQALRDLGGEYFMGRELYVAAAVDKARNGGSRGRRARREARGAEARGAEARGAEARGYSSRDYISEKGDDYGWEDVS